jgi:hypothetical protein
MDRLVLLGFLEQMDRQVRQESLALMVRLGQLVQQVWKVQLERLELVKQELQVLRALMVLQELLA